MESWRARGTALLLGAGGLAIVLAAVASDRIDLERYLVPKALALHLTALLGLAGLSLGAPRFRLGVIELLLGAALVSSAVSTALAVNRWLAVSALGISVSTTVVFLMARSLGGTGTARTAVWMLAGLGVLASLFGLAQAHGVEWDLFAAERAPGGSFGNRNFLAHFAVIALPATLLAALEARRAPGRALAFAGLLAIAGAVVLTRSRAAWLAGLASVGAAGLAVIRCRGWREAVGPRRFAHAGAVLLAGAAVAALLPNRLSWSSDSPYRDSLRGLLNYREGSGRGRLVQYRNSLELFGEAPVLGVGPGNWFVHYPRVTTPADPSFAGYDPIPTNPWPSSDWIAFLTERGAVGTLLFALAGGAALLVASRRLGRDPVEQQGRSVALIGVLVAAAVAGAFDAVLLLPAPAFLTAGLSGLLLPPTRPVLEGAAGSRPRSAYALAMLFLVAVVLLSWRQLDSIRASTQGASRETLEAASRRDPGNHRLHLRLATRGPCADRLRHAEAARRLLPHHDYPRRLVRRCG